MYFEKYGSPDKPVLFLIHSEGLVEVFHQLYAPLTERFYVIVPHLLGSGKEVGKDFSFEESEKQVIEIIRQQKRKVYIAGHSLGGNLVFSMISHYPQYFEKAIISSPMIDQTDEDARKKAGKTSITSLITGMKFMNKKYIKLLGLESQEEIKFFLDYRSKISKKTWSNYYTDRITFESCPQFANCDIPILCVFGMKEDKDFQRTAIQMKEINKRTEMQCIDGADHDYPFKKTDELKKIMIDFFR